MQPDVRADAPTGSHISDLRLFLSILILLFPIYLVTADRHLPYHIDPFTNVISAATIAETGSPILDGYAELTDSDARAILGWVIESPRGPVSQYPPGTALLAAPAYFFAGDGEMVEIVGRNDPNLSPVEVEIPPLWPAAVTSSLASALAVALTSVTVRRVTGSVKWAVGTGLVLAAGTGLWLNGAYQLWQHGASALWIALGLFAASRRSWLGSGLALGLAILTRPPVAIISAGIGIWAGWRERSWKPLLFHGTGAAVGLVVLLAYNYWLFDTLTVSGGYGSGFTDNLAESGLDWYATNVFGGLFSLYRGLFVWSPVVLVAGLGLRKAWAELPGWSVGALLGGVVLLLVQFRLNRYSGGDGFWSYRYPIEAVVAATPALSAAARKLWTSGRPGRTAVLASAAASVAFHMIALIQELI